MEVSYSFEVTGNSLYYVFDQAWKQAARLFDDPPLSLNEFHRFDITPQLYNLTTGEVTTYVADVTVVRQARMPERVMKFD